MFYPSKHTTPVGLLEKELEEKGIESIERGTQERLPLDAYEIQATDKGIRVLCDSDRSYCYGLANVLEDVNLRRPVESRVHKPKIRRRLSETYAPMAHQTSQNSPPYLEHTWHTMIQHPHHWPEYDAILDEDEAAKAAIRFEEYCFTLLRDGYNGLVLDGMVYMPTYKKLNDGKGIYDTDSHWYQRALAYQKYFKKLIAVAKKYYLDFYLMSCEFAFSNPLRDYIGEMDVNNPRMWETLKERYREVLTSIPEFKGALIKWTDGGDGNQYTYHNRGIYIYDHEEKDRTKAKVKNLRPLLNDIASVVCGELNKELIFRTWDVGDDGVHAIPENQREVFQDVVDDELVYQCIKNGKCDFWLHSKTNPNLGGFPRQYVEYQHKMEHDGHSSVPLYMGRIFEERVAGNVDAGVEGIWSWPVGGGRRAHNTIPHFQGFERWAEVNFFVFNRLLWDSNETHRDHLLKWAELEYGKEAARAMVEIMELSPKAVDCLFYDEKTRLLDFGPHSYADWQEFRYRRMKSSCELMADTENVMRNKNQAVELFQQMADLWSRQNGNVEKLAFVATQKALDDALLYSILIRDVNEVMLKLYRDQKDGLNEAVEKLLASKTKYDALYGTHITDDLRLLIDEALDCQREKNNPS